MGNVAFLYALHINMRTQERHLLFVDSRDRDPSYASPFEFTVMVNSANRISCNAPSFKNVSEISVKAFSMPKVEGEHYVYLDLGPQLNNTIYGTDTSITDQMMGVFYFDSGVMPTGNVKPMKGQDFTPKVTTFSPYLTEVDRFPIKVVKHGGQTVAAGDVGGGDPFFTLLLEIVTHSRVI
jgi:hypothetical protein